MARRTLPLAFLVLALVGAPGGAAAQDGSFTVVVFEGRGLGHGLGMPLDGANAAALEKGATADTVLDRFYPGTGRASESGIVRVLVAARDDPEAGIEVTLPGGGTIRDGRTTAVAPSFPIPVPSDGRVRLSFEAGRYRAEVLDERSVSGTVEITPTSASAPPTTEGSTSSTRAEAPPGLGASEQTLWLLPRNQGSIVLSTADGGDTQAFPGPVEVIIEAKRMHLVAEVDVETYLTRLDFSMPGGTPLEPAAIEAAVIAARSYALRSALAQPRVGGFHLYADERSLPYARPGHTSGAVRAAVRRTRGRVVTDGGEPAAALLCTSAGGKTASVAEVYGAERDAPSYLVERDYPGGQEFSWRVEIGLDDVAAKLGYTGEADAISVAARGGSGRPTRLRVGGTAGDLDVDSEEFHDALRLPSSMFDIRTESRSEALPGRDPSPQFQQLPGDPIVEAAGGSEAPEHGSSRVPIILALVAGATLVVAFLVLLIADVQRRMRRYRERRETRLRHASAREESGRIEAEVATSAEPQVEDADASPIEGPTWHNEPEWLSELFPDDESPGDPK